MDTPLEKRKSIFSNGVPSYTAIHVKPISPLGITTPSSDKPIVVLGMSTPTPYKPTATLGITPQTKVNISRVLADRMNRGG